MARIEITGLDDLRRALRQAGDLALVALAAAAVEEQEKVMAESKTRAPVDDSTLRSSGTVLHPKVSGTRVEVIAGYGGAASQYAIVMHEGRRKNMPMPPIAPIKAWAKKHGLPPEAAFPIARKIGRKGIKGRKFLEDPFNERKPKMAFELARGVARAWRRLAK